MCLIIVCMIWKMFIIRRDDFITVCNYSRRMMFERRAMSRIVQTLMNLRVNGLRMTLSSNQSLCLFCHSFEHGTATVIGMLTSPASNPSTTVFVFHSYWKEMTGLTHYFTGIARKKPWYIYFVLKRLTRRPLPRKMTCCIPSLLPRSW